MDNIVRHLIEVTNYATPKHETEMLIEGDTITKRIEEYITYSEIDRFFDKTWSYLYMTGCLTTTSCPTRDYYTLRIPNNEIRQVYKNQLMERFRENVRKEVEAK